jgi:signal transduction histidine kinase/ActR/RegA family two-component response regulator
MARAPQHAPRPPESGARPGRMQAALDRLARWRLGPLGDEEDRRWVRVVLVGGLLFLLFGVAWSVWFFGYGEYAVASFMLASVLVLPTVFMLMRSLATLRVGVQVWLLALLAGISLANLMTGGLAGANVATFVVVPLAALILAGRTAWIWGLLTALVMTAFEIARLLGFSFPSAVPQAYLEADQAWTWAAVMAFIIGMSAYYERERLRAARMLREARDRAEEASRAKGEFLANMSHEVRTPLHAIIGLLDLSLADGRADLESQERLAQAKASAVGLVRVIEDILDLSRMEAGQPSLRPAMFELREALEEVLAPLGLLARRKGLAFAWSAAPELPGWLRGDAQRLRQILLNLVGNALKFTEHGRVEVRARQASADAERVELEVEIEDTGIGVSPERQQAIFEPFVQADGSTTRRFGGTGLGLTIARRLVEEMGGEIGLASAPGLGSTFRFTAWLGRAPASQPEAPAQLAPAAPPGPLRVLLAEDDPVSGLVTRQMLERLGHRVETVGDGRAAQEALEHGGFELALLDVQMPVQDGLETVRRLRARERERGGHLPVISLTAHALDGDRERCLAAGMDGYLSKPLELAALEAEIRRLFAARRAQS